MTKKMLNNLVNKNDLKEVIRRVKSNPNLAGSIARKFFSTKNNRAIQAWSHVSAPQDKWWYIPEVISRWNYLITGDYNLDYYAYITEKYLRNKGKYKALSLACGTGSREIEWAKTNKFGAIDAFDASPRRISFAKSQAEKENLSDIISFNVENVLDVRPNESEYDLFLGEQSLHHFSPLNEVVEKIKYSVKPNGLIIVNEYAGPDRFQWSEEQVYYAKELLIKLPEKYRTFYNSVEIKNDIYKPGRMRMIMNDPSEAIESSKILPLFSKNFELLEFKPCAGTLLHLVFDGIAHNFLNEETVTKELLKMCFDFEDTLLTHKKIESDFIFVMYRNRK